MAVSGTDLVTRLRLGPGLGEPVLLAFDAAERQALAERIEATPTADRRLAIILAAATTSTEFDELLTRLHRAGYAVNTLPTDHAALLAQLQQAGPGGEELARSDYELFFGTLPTPFQTAVLQRWGPVEEDPLFRPGELDCGRFLLPRWQPGPVAVGRSPVTGYRLAAVAGDIDPAQAPPHGYLAFCCWLRDTLRITVAIDVCAAATC